MKGLARRFAAPLAALSAGLLAQALPNSVTAQTASATAPAATSRAERAVRAETAARAEERIEPASPPADDASSDASPPPPLPADAEPAPAATRATDPAIAISKAVAQLPQAPSLATLQAAAVTQARIDPRAAGRWVTRARASAALPSFSSSYNRRVDNGWELDQEAGTADDYSTDVGAVHTLRFRATWELDRLVFNPDELRASRAQLDLLDWRAEVLVQVTQLYFEHRRLCLERALAPETDLTKSIAREVRILEIEGLLTGLTHVRWR